MVRESRRGSLLGAKLSCPVVLSSNRDPRNSSVVTAQSVCEVVEAGAGCCWPAFVKRSEGAGDLSLSLGIKPWECSSHSRTREEPGARRSRQDAEPSAFSEEVFSFPGGHVEPSLKPARPHGRTSL